MRCGPSSPVDPPPGPSAAPGARWSARQVLLNITAETAQHAGQADIHPGGARRRQADGLELARVPQNGAEDEGLPVSKLNMVGRATASLAASLVLLGTVATAGAAESNPTRRPAGASEADRVAASRPIAVTAAPSPRGLAGALPLGSLPGGQAMRGVVALKLRDESGLAALISAASEPESEQFRHYLSAAAFENEFGPTPSTVASVRSELERDGLAVTGVSRNGLLISFAGTASRVERAFRTGIERYRLSDGVVGYATTSPIEMPASVASSVAAVVGLDDLVNYRSRLVRRPTLANSHSGRDRVISPRPSPAPRTPVPPPSRKRSSERSPTTRSPTPTGSTACTPGGISEPARLSISSSWSPSSRAM